MQRNQMVFDTVCYNTFWPVGATAAPLPRTEGATTAVSYQGNTGGDGDGLFLSFFFELHVDTAL